MLASPSRKCLLVVAIASVLGGCAAESDDAESDGAQAIVGGQVDTKHPAVGLLEPKDHEGYRTANDYCTGTLVAPDRVLTSATCALAGEQDPSRTIVRFYTGAAVRESVGGRGFDTTGMTGHAVRSATIHPTFDASSGSHNFALLTLESPIDDTEPLAIGSGSSLAKGTRCDVVGYGPRQTGNLWHYGQKRTGVQTIDKVDRESGLVEAGTHEMREMLVGANGEEGHPNPLQAGGDEGAPLICGGHLTAGWTRAMDFWSSVERNVLGAAPTYTVMDDETLRWIREASTKAN